MNQSTFGSCVKRPFPLHYQPSGTFVPKQACRLGNRFTPVLARRRSLPSFADGAVQYQSALERVRRSAIEPRASVLQRPPGLHGSSPFNAARAGSRDWPPAERRKQSSDDTGTSELITQAKHVRIVAFAQIAQRSVGGSLHVCGQRGLLERRGQFSQLTQKIPLDVAQILAACFASHLAMKLPTSFYPRLDCRLFPRYIHTRRIVRIKKGSTLVCRQTYRLRKAALAEKEPFEAKGH